MRKIVILAALIVLCSCGDTPPNYFTIHGMAVTVGDSARPGPKTVEKWTDTTIIFWRFFYPSWLVCMNNSTSMTHAYFHDKDFVWNNGEKVAGYSEHKTLSIHISNGSTSKVRGVFAHELSHVFVGECGGVWSQNGSHAIFDELGLDKIMYGLP